MVQLGGQDSPPWQGTFYCPALPHVLKPGVTQLVASPPCWPPRPTGQFSAGGDLEYGMVPIAPSWCWRGKWHVLAHPGLQAKNCLFGQLRTRLQLNHKIRRKPLSWVAQSWFPPRPLQAVEWGPPGRGASGNDSRGSGLHSGAQWRGSGASLLSNPWC